MLNINTILGICREDQWLSEAYIRLKYGSLLLLQFKFELASKMPKKLLFSPLPAIWPGLAEGQDKMLSSIYSVEAIARVP